VLTDFWTGTLAARALAALIACVSVPAGQFGTIQREQKICSRTGGFSGPIGNDYRFGVSVSELGDFDGDGIRDLAVGSHRANIGGVERGAVWLLYMNASGTVREHRQISALEGGFAGPLEDNDRFGISLCSLGDLDLDGTTDIAVGAYRDDDGGTDFGCVYVLFLAPDGTVKAEQKISALEGGFGGTLSMEDSFGWSVENIGDLDDDGVIDLAVGATRDDGGDPDATQDFGALYLLFLNADGTVKSHSRIGLEPSGFGALLRPRDRFGADVVLLEDPDGDGVEDLAVGAFGEDPAKYGRVFVLHLETDGGVKSYQEIGRSTGGFTGLLGRGDRFGISLAADDFDGDGLSDLVVGAAGDDDGGADAGALWVCLLNAQGRVKGFEKISPDFGGFGGLLHPGDNFGISCATLGDLDRDGAVDLAAGAYQDDTGGLDRGAAWVMFRAGIGLPVADFVSTPPTGETPLTVSFKDRSSGSISGWSWNFDDGTAANERNPVHVFTEPGVYDVTLWVRGKRGSDSLHRQRAVVVKDPEPPVADFTVTPAVGPAPLSATFSDLSTGSITAWSWDFGDGTTSSLRYPKHIYQEIGTYSVTLMVTGRMGTSTKPSPSGGPAFERALIDRKTVPDLIHAVEPPPVAGFAAEPVRGFPPLSVAFRDQSTPNVTSWTWAFGDGTSSSEREPRHTYGTVGLFDVTLSVRGPSGSGALSRADLVEVLQPLRAAFDVVSPGGVAPVSVQFFDRSLGGATSWRWSFGDGMTSELRNPIHRFEEGGTFPVQLTVEGQGQIDSETIPVEIGEPPPDARFSVSTAAGDVPLRVSFMDRSTGNVTAWQWDFGDGHGSFERNPFHAYLAAGVYTVRFRVWSAGGVDTMVRRDFIHVANPLHRVLQFGGATGPLPTLRPPKPKF